MDSLFKYLVSTKPFTTVKEAQIILKLTYQGANKIIKNFIDIGILKETSSNKRNREFVFAEYQDLVFNLIDKD